MTELAQGEIVSCDDCNRARPIKTPVISVFGSHVAFGPAGETDMFVERDGDITCYHCMSDETADKYAGKRDIL